MYDILTKELKALDEKIKEVKSEKQNAHKISSDLFIEIEKLEKTLDNSEESNKTIERVYEKYEHHIAEYFRKDDYLTLLKERKELLKKLCENYNSEF